MQKGFTKSVILVKKGSKKQANIEFCLAPSKSILKDCKTLNKATFINICV